MNNTASRQNSRRLAAGPVLSAAVLLAAFLLFGPATMALAAEQDATETPGQPEAATAAAVVPDSEFQYLIEDRKDPFVPFITERAATADVNMDEIVEKEEELTGMQLFEPGQLTLVALLRRGQTPYAMVEDFTGKGYVIGEGTKIGRRGIVKQIIPNKVLIEETAVTRAGRKIVTQTVMVLRKEGDE